MKKSLIIKFFILLFLSTRLYAEEVPRLSQAPFFTALKLQYAGELGFLSLGVTKKTRPWYEFSLMYGYLPPWDESPAIHTLALKQDFTLLRSEQNVRFYFDLTFLMALGEQYWSTFHKDGFDFWYFFGNSTELILALGLEAPLPLKNNKTSIYTEIGVLGHWVKYYYENPSTVKFEDMATITFGLNYSF